jgi:hypothetical protein
LISLLLLWGRLRFNKVVEWLCLVLNEGDRDLLKRHLHNLLVLCLLSLIELSCGALAVALGSQIVLRPIIKGVRKYVEMLLSSSGSSLSH